MNKELKRLFLCSIIAWLALFLHTYFYLYFKQFPRSFSAAIIYNFDWINLRWSTTAILALIFYHLIQAVASFQVPVRHYRAGKGVGYSARDANGLYDQISAVTVPIESTVKSRNRVKNSKTPDSAKLWPRANFTTTPTRKWLPKTKTRFAATNPMAPSRPITFGSLADQLEHQPSQEDCDDMVSDVETLDEPGVLVPGPFHQVSNDDDEHGSAEPHRR